MKKILCYLSAAVIIITLSSFALTARKCSCGGELKRSDTAYEEKTNKNCPSCNGKTGTNSCKICHGTGKVYEWREGYVCQSCGKIYKIK